VKRSDVKACVCEFAFICAKRVRALWGVAVKADGTHLHLLAYMVYIYIYTQEYSQQNTHELAAEWAYFRHDLTLN